MNDDTRFLLRSVGCVPAVFGAVSIALGAVLAATGGRYMGLALIFALMYGGAASGLGLVVLATGRRWIALAGALLCALSAALTSLYGVPLRAPLPLQPFEPWQIAILILDAIVILAALAQVFRRRNFAPAPASPPSPPSRRA